MQEFDALIVITGKDYDRVHKNYPRLFKYLPARDIIFIGNEEVAERLEIRIRICFDHDIFKNKTAVAALAQLAALLAPA